MEVYGYSLGLSCMHSEDKTIKTITSKVNITLLVFLNQLFMVYIYHRFLLGLLKIW